MASLLVASYHLHHVYSIHVLLKKIETKMMNVPFSRTAPVAVVGCQAGDPTHLAASLQTL